MRYRNIYALFSDGVEKYRGRNIFYARQGDQWKAISWDSFAEEARAFGCGLIASGLAKGGAVSILMSNVPAWPVSDVGTIIVGGVGVGLYPTNSAEQCQYIIDHSDAEFILVDTAHQLDKILQVREQLPKLKAIIALDEEAARKTRGVMSYQDFLELGRAHRDESLPILIDRAESAQPEDIAIIVYTSGTTGLPKGACLSHRYVINSVESWLEVLGLNDEDVAFSYLPYCHAAERIAGLYTRLYAGIAAYFVDDITKLWDYTLEVKPTFFGGLPRFFEKPHARLMTDVEKSPPEERERFYHALALGKRVSRLGQAREAIPADLKRDYEQNAQPVLSKVNDYFGGRVRIATSGGAPLPLEIAEFFDACGVHVLQGYGLTENLCVAFNRPDNCKIGTVGPPMPGCSVKIAADGEILVQSHMMFSGYYKEPEKTAEVFRDGWLLTGDIGELDEEGFLRITGRKKELIITSTGKNVAPALIENLLKEDPIISHAMAYGDGKSYLVALITLNQAETEAYAHNHAIEYRDFADLICKKEIVARVEKIVEGVNLRVSSTEAIKKFVILDHDLSIEADEVTPTMKVKRNVVARRYGDLLEGMYR
jgi:long-chain acyl-CoA synthetase